MLLKCQNKKCMYEWDYKGESPFYATCPRCKSSVKVKRGDTNERVESRGVRNEADMAQDKEVI